MNPVNVCGVHNEARAFLDITYVTQGPAAESAGLMCSSFARYLSPYNRSPAGNAAKLVAKTWN